MNNLLAYGNIMPSFIFDSDSEYRILVSSAGCSEERYQLRLKLVILELFQISSIISPHFNFYKQL